MIRYSPKAAKALGFLKTAYNDVEIYVEDETCHHMYLLLFRKILPPWIRLTSVNQLVVRRNHRIPYWRGLCNDAGCARGSASK